MIINDTVVSKQELEKQRNALETRIKRLEIDSVNAKHPAMINRDLEKAKKELTDLNYRIDHYKEKPKNINKRRVISNIRELAAQKKVKIGEIETAAGKAPGYSSRINKPDNTSELSAEFIVTAAKMLNVSVDDLLNRDYRGLENQQAPLTESERYLLNFISKLEQETINATLIWKKLTESDFLSSTYDIESHLSTPNYPLVEVRFDIVEDDNPVSGYPATFEQKYYVSHFYESGSTVLNGSSYYVTLPGSNSQVYLTNIMHYEDGDDEMVCPFGLLGDRELYIVTGTEVEALCTTDTKCEDIRDALYVLYQAIEDNLSRFKVSGKSKNIIDGFMNTVF